MRVSRRCFAQDQLSNSFWCVSQQSNLSRLPSLINKAQFRWVVVNLWDMKFRHQESWKVKRKGSCTSDMSLTEIVYS